MDVEHPYLGDEDIPVAVCNYDDVALLIARPVGSLKTAYAEPRASVLGNAKQDMFPIQEATQRLVFELDSRLANTSGK